MIKESVNILSQFVDNPNGLFTYLESLKPSAVVVMDNPSLCAEIRARIPGCIGIHRSYDPHEHEWHTAAGMSPSAWLDRYAPQILDGNVLQCLNEPQGYGDLTPLVSWCVSIMAQAHQRGIRLCLPHFGVGHPKEDFSPQLDPLWQAFAQFPEHLLGLHEYFQLDPLAEPFRTGRFRSILTRCQQLGLPPPKIVITEAGRDVGGGLNDGWKGAGFSEQVYASKLNQQASIYLNTPVIAMCVFCMGHGAGGNWESFDIQHAQIVQQSMIDWNRSHPVTQPNYGTRIDSGKVVLVNASAVNVRSAPNTGMPILGKLFGGEDLPYWSQPVNTWWQIEWNGQLAYTSSTYVRFEQEDAINAWIQEMQVHNDAIADLLSNPPS